MIKENGLVAFLKKAWRALLSRYDSLGLILYPLAYFKIPKAAQKISTATSAVNFSFDKIGGIIEPTQIRWELSSLAQIVESLHPRIILEVGTARGGTLFTFSRLAKDDAIIISIDLPGGNFGGGYPQWKESLYKKFAAGSQKIFLLRADSHSDQTVKKIRDILSGRKIDFLFIDGDHTYEGVAKDFTSYSSFVREGGIIAFHDIRSPEPTYGVPRLWSELKQRHSYKEFLIPGGVNMGIGVLFMK